LTPGLKMQTRSSAGKQGLTGVPLVDAGMRQLLAKGWMHNRARLVAASFLTRPLNMDWREGAAHFWIWLVDGYLAINAGNWQWVAGTGNATRRAATMNPTRQARRFDSEWQLCAALRARALRPRGAPDSRALEAGRDGAQEAWLSRSH
jgi:deoxyribodipyrimidine photolyase